MSHINWIAEPDASDDDDTREIITLPILANETRPLVTMRHQHPDVYPDIENIRVGSLVYIVAKSNGYRVWVVQ